MAVRIRIRIAPATSASQISAIEAVAIANSGFETDAPEVLLPAAVAARLGLWPAPADVVQKAQYESPFGSRTLTFIPSAIVVRLKQSAGPIVRCGVTVSEDEDQVVLSDQAVGALRIELVDVARGTWKVRGERKLRRSSKPQRW
jgi:hypothetical protein